MHQSVGIIIKNDHGQILMLDRKNYPQGWACPAGHVDQGEGPEKAAHREAEEETGIQIKEIHKLIQEFVEWNECAQGIKGHYWHVYEAVSWDGAPKTEDKEAKTIKWIHPEELKDMELEPVWKYWFEKLDLI